MSKNMNAFPRAATWSPDGQQVVAPQSGMSLRDYFATHAPTVSDQVITEDIPGFPVFDNSGYYNGFPAAEIRARQKAEQMDWMRWARIAWRWRYADAMLEERDRKS